MDHLILFMFFLLCTLHTSYCHIEKLVTNSSILFHIDIVKEIHAVALKAKEVHYL